MSEEGSVTSLEFLQTIYRNPAVPLPVRIRAAGIALPFEHPKLGVSVNVAWSDEMAARLEQAIARSNQVLIERPKVIEHQPPEQSLIEHPTEARGQVSSVIGSVPDRRFRRA